MASEVHLGTLPVQAYLVTSHDEHQVNYDKLVYKRPKIYLYTLGKSVRNRTRIVFLGFLIPKAKTTTDPSFELRTLFSNFLKPSK